MLLRIKSLSILLTFSQLLIGQIIYISPVNHSNYNKPETNIIVRFNSGLSKQNDLASSFKLINQDGIDLEFSIKLVENNTCLIIQSKTKFNLGDTISLFLKKTLHQDDDFSIDSFHLDFIVSRKRIKSDSVSFDTINKAKYKNNEVPETFPKFTITVNNNPASGKIFFYNLSKLGSNNDRYLTIIDSTGNPFFWKQESNKGLNFTLQSSGYLSYWNENNFVLMDTTYKIVDTIGCGNGYTADWHEFINLPDHHSFLIAWDLQEIDMSKIVENGKTNTIVTGAIIQELDENKNVIFQWRSWDHFKITDAVGVDFTAYSFSYVHANALEIDKDSNILLSSRLMNEITKIDRKTGNIIWRLGGKNNQFTFLNDTARFCHQHDIRRIDNGNITLYDNGECHVPQISRAKEYHLDENNKTAELIWFYEHPKKIYCDIMGNVQRLPNGNTFINWGMIDSINLPSITEVKPDKSIVFELYMKEEFNLLYRSHKFNWNYKMDSTLTSIQNYNSIKAEELNIYPNPVTDRAEIIINQPDFKNGSLSIYNINGDKVKSINLYTNRMRLNLSNLKSGIYFAIVKSNNKVFIQKFIKS